MPRVDRQQQASWRSGDLVDVRGDRCKVDETESWPDCVSLRLVSVDRASATRTLLVPFDRPRRVERRRGLRSVKLRRWLHTVRRALIDAHPFGGLRSAAECPIRLLSHQLEPALAVLRRGVVRILIADGVGLGKTIQAGLIARELLSRSDAFRALVLVPAGLRDQWAQELSSHFDMHAVQADAGWLRRMSMELPPGINPWSMPGIYVVSLDFAKRPEVLHPIEETVWDLCVIDEAHLASTGTDRRAAAHAIASHSRRVVLLTATPHDGEPAEIDALSRIGALGTGGSAMVVFRRSRVDVGSMERRRTILLRVTLSPSERRMHELLDRYTAEIWNEARRQGDTRARLVSVVLRKRALSSAASLDASIRRRLDLLAGSLPEPAIQLALPLSDEDPIEEDAAPSHVLAIPGMQDGRRERRWLTSIAQAAQNASRLESKTRRLLRLLARVSEPFILFTEYRDTLHRLERVIATTGRPALVLHGGMEAHERRRVQDRFNCGGISLLTTDAASEGLNLHYYCRLVIHYELPWSASRIEQRTGRVDRLGQSRRVHEIALVASDTAERLVLAPLARRAAQACATGGASTGLLARLTEPCITEAIFGERRVPIPASRPEIPETNLRPLDLRIEATAETARLARIRQASSRSGPSRIEPAVLTGVRRGRSGLPTGLALVLFVTVRDSFGRFVHAEPRVVHLARWRRLVDETRTTEPPRAYSSDDRVALLAMLRGPEPGWPAPLRHTCRQLASDVLQKVEADHAGWRETELERERGIAAGTSSNSIQLVQAGLFDQRGLRDLAQRRQSRAALNADASARLSAISRTTLSAEIILLAAVVIGGSQA